MKDRKNDNRVLVLDKSQAYCAKIEDVSSFDESIFGNEYKKVMQIIEEIVRINENIKGDNEEINNIISIVGDRGTGKSSILLTLGKLLESEKVKNDYEALRKKNFKVMTTIDPSKLEKNDSILRLVLSQMFADYSQKVNENREINNDKSREILMAFKEVYKNLCNLSLSNDEIKNEYENELETLYKLSASLSLRSTFSKLVDNYLELNSKSDSTYLVITIDDMDMNMSYAYSMIEDIRKYLMVPKVIVLMSYHYGQLKKVIEKQYAFEYSHLLELALVQKSEIEDLADKYIEKIMPPERRINIGKVDYGIMMVREEGEEKKKTFGELIAEIIREKCGIYIANDYLSKTMIVNKNLRAYLNHYYLIAGYKSVEHNKENVITNLKSYRIMLLSKARENLLDERKQSILIKLSEANNISECVRELIIDLVSILQEKVEDINRKDEEAIEIDNSMLKIISDDFEFSHGYVVCLDMMYQKAWSKEDKVFLEILEMLYQIKLQEFFVQDKESIREFLSDSEQYLLVKEYSIYRRRAEKREIINSWNLLKNLQKLREEKVDVQPIYDNLKEIFVKSELLNTDSYSDNIFSEPMKVYLRPLHIKFQTEKTYNLFMNLSYCRKICSIEEDEILDILYNNKKFQRKKGILNQITEKLNLEEFVDFIRDAREDTFFDCNFDEMQELISYMNYLKELYQLNYLKNEKIREFLNDNLHYFLKGDIKKIRENYDLEYIANNIEIELMTVDLFSSVLLENIKEEINQYTKIWLYNLSYLAHIAEKCVDLFIEMLPLKLNTLQEELAFVFTEFRNNIGDLIFFGRKRAPKKNEMIFSAMNHDIMGINIGLKINDVMQTIEDNETSLILENGHDLNKDIVPQIKEIYSLLQEESYKPFDVDRQKGVALVQQVLDEFDMRKIKHKLKLID